MLDHRTRARALVNSLSAGDEELVLRATEGAAALGQPEACLGTAAYALAATSIAPEHVEVRTELAAAEAGRGRAPVSVDPESPPEESWRRP